MEVLFRGKRIDNGEWVEGYYIKWLDGTTSILSHEGCMSDVITETIGQYTGLKDKNGRRIFEGDIIKMSDGEIGAVAYSDDCAGYELASGGCTLCLSKAKERLVIGNIHDNPEFFMEV